MKINDILAQKDVSLSFEVFPPKESSKIETIRTACMEIADLKPDFMSVTYGAGGGTSDYTVGIAKSIQDTGVTALAHLTCVNSDEERINAVLSEMKKSGIENVLALRGDRKPDMPEEDGFYKYAFQLVERIRREDSFCIGAACYPEGHVESANRGDDIDRLKMKVDCGCDFLTTQMFFDNSVLYSFLYRIMRKNINVPVVAGIMPVTNGKQIARVCALSGTSLPNRFRMMLDRFGDNPEAMKQAGIAYAAEQIIDLVSNGIKAIHVYTMNKPDIARRLCTELSSILGR